MLLMWSRNKAGIISCRANEAIQFAGVLISTFQECSTSSLLRKVQTVLQDPAGIWQLISMS